MESKYKCYVCVTAGVEMTAKKVQPSRLQGFFIGIDPATQNDYFGIGVQALMEKPKNLQFDPADAFKWTPYLVDLVRMKKRDPMEMTDILTRVFNKYPPTYVTIDSTREEFLANALVHKYGDQKVIPMKFGNVGSMNTKFKLKQIGYAYINAGYEWPDPATLERNGFSRFATLLKILKKEMLLEQVEYTETQRVTFKHPIGKHNDLVHAWEMSLNSVMEWQQKRLGFQKRVGMGENYEALLSQDQKGKRGRFPKVEVEDMVMGTAPYDVEWHQPP